MRRERLSEIAAVVVAVGVPTAMAVVWQALDRSPPQNDDLTLFGMAACLADRLPAPTAVMACSALGPYPPLVPLVAALGFLLRGDATVHVAVGTLTLGYAGLAAALYAGVRAESGRLAAIVAAWLGPALWLASGCRSSFYTESTMAALAAAGVAALVWSRGLSRPGPAAILGGALGLGMLTKWSFAFFLAPPVGVAVLAAGLSLGRRPAPGLLVAAAVVTGAGLVGAGLLGIATGGTPYGAVLLVSALAGSLALAFGPPAWRRGDTRTRLVALALALGLPALIAGPWYVSASAMLDGFLGKNLAHDYAGDAIGFAEAWPFYPATAVHDLGLPLLLVAAAGALRTLLPGRSRFTAWCLFTVACGAIVLTAAPYRSGRYLTPGYPLLAPAMLLLGTGPALPLGVVRVGFALFALASQTFLTFPGDPRRMPWNRWANERTAHVGGNTRADLDMMRLFLTHPPFAVPIVTSAPHASAPDLSAMIDTLPLPAAGALAVVVVDHPALTDVAVKAELIHHHATGRLRMVPAAGGDPAAIVAMARAAPARWVLEVSEYPVGTADPARGQKDDVLAREAALRAAGFTIRREDKTIGPTVRLDRVWGPVEEP